MIDPPLNGEPNIKGGAILATWITNGERAMTYGPRVVTALGLLMVALFPVARAVELGQGWNMARNYANVKRMGGAATVGTYLMGAGNAYLVANASATAMHQPLLYCQPPALEMNALNYLEIFEKELSIRPSAETLE